MQFFEIATLTVPVGLVTIPGPKTDVALAAIKAFVETEDAAGTLLGCWTPEIALQNRIVVLRGFESRDEMMDERQRVLMSDDPFGCGNLLVSLKLEGFARFPGLPAITRGTFGPVYEFRTYRLKIGGLAPSLEAWGRDLPARAALSPVVNVMYALDGEPRFTHIWAYRSFEERTAIRAEALRTKVWPAKGGPDWITTDMHSEVLMPTAISPLQ